MLYRLFFVSLSLSMLPISALAQKIVLTNDDGWAVANIRAQYDALKASGFNVVLSAPAENKSGTGSSSATPQPLTQPCEFDTCPTGSPAEGFNSSDARLNYVNSFPVDSVRYGIQTLAPKFFDTPPDFVVSGFNVGNNLGSIVNTSGTVGAACEAALEGIPSVAFSAGTGLQISYTTLSTNASSPMSKAARTYAKLTATFVRALLEKRDPILPPGISLNVNYPQATNCSSASDYRFVLTRLLADSNAVDVETCRRNHLPDESSVVNDDSGCFASVSVFNASTKADVDASTQKVVLRKLSKILTCWPLNHS